MDVWLIQTGEPFPFGPNVKKMRTAHLAEKLIERGHSVVWWTSAFDHFHKDWIFRRDTETTLKNGVKIIALKGIGYSKNLSLSRFLDHRIIARKFKRRAKFLERPDLIVASTPPYDLAYESVMFAKDQNIPVIVDIRDEWPDLFVNTLPSIFRPLLKVLLIWDFRMIQATMQRADGLVAMMDSLLDWGLRYAGRPRGSRDRVFYLGDKKNIPPTEPETTLSYAAALKGKFTVVFVGTFVQNNNPSILLDCAEKLKNRPFQFVLAGKGELLDDLKRRAANLPNVIFPGWLDEEEMRTLLRHSHIGVCPTTQVRDAFPNKAFSYLSAGLPILSAFQGELKKIIENHRLGLSYRPNDVEELIRSILTLSEDRGLYKQMAENAKRFFDENFDADKIYRFYALYIEDMAREFKPNH